MACALTSLKVNLSSQLDSDFIFCAVDRTYDLISSRRYAESPAASER